VGDDPTEFAAFLRGWADAELRGYSPPYETIARRLADDTALLARIAAVAAREKLVPVLLFAAVKSIVDDEPESPLARIYAGGPGDAWTGFRDLLERRFDEVAGLVRARRIQTNEVGRAAAILPALGIAHRRAGGPLALIEIGPSAGLNLLLDRFAYDYGAGRTAGDPASPVRLVCETRGPLVPPVPTAMPRLASRRGIDLSPVDVTDDAECRWLEACLWPGAPERTERLRAAIGLARRDPPLLERGNMLDLLPRVLGEVADDAVPCVLSTWVLAYLSADERARVGAIMEHAAAKRGVLCITAEFEGVPPWTPPAPRRAAVGEARIGTLVAMTWWRSGVREARALAWMHAHGGWIDWLDAETAGR
jgi:hypothetical protein